MQLSLPILRVGRPGLRHAGWGILLALGALLALPVARQLWVDWRTMNELSHGPLVPLIALGLLWARRDQLRAWNAAAPGGLVLFGCAALLHLLSVWGDVEFMKSLSLVLMLAGAIWYFGGAPAIRAAAGPL